jgi:hypothetical protein
MASRHSRFSHSSRQSNNWRKTGPYGSVGNLKKACVYCHDDDGEYFGKNGETEIGRHHVNDCCKAAKRAKAKREANRRQPSYKKEVGGWTRKIVKNKTRVSSNVRDVLERSKDPFSVLSALEEDEQKQQRLNEIKKANAKAKQAKKFMNAVNAKQIPRACSIHAVVKSGWVNAVNKRKSVAVKPEVTKPSPKRVNDLKNEVKIPPPSPPFIKSFNKGAVMSFEEAAAKFSKTCCWGDSDDEC